MFRDVTNSVSAHQGAPQRETPIKARGATADRFGGKGSGSIYDVAALSMPPASSYGAQRGFAERSYDAARSGKAFGSQSRFEGYGSTYAERGTSVHTPGAGAYTPQGTRTSARKKSVVRLQAAFRGAISRRMSRGLFADQLRVARAQPGPGNYEAHTLNTIAHNAEPLAGEVSNTSAFRDSTLRFEDKSSIYAHARTDAPGVGTYNVGVSPAKGDTFEEALPQQRSAWARASERSIHPATLSKGRSPRGAGTRAPDSADKLREAAHRLLVAQHAQRDGQLQPRRPVVQPPAAQSTVGLVQAPSSLRAAMAPQAPAGLRRAGSEHAKTGGSGAHGLVTIDEAQPPAAGEAGAVGTDVRDAQREAEEEKVAIGSAAAELSAKLSNLKLGNASGGKKVRFSVGITVGAYEPLMMMDGEKASSPVVSEGGGRHCSLPAPTCPFFLQFPPAAVPRWTAGTSSHFRPLRLTSRTARSFHSLPASLPLSQALRTARTNHCLLHILRTTRRRSPPHLATRRQACPPPGLARTEATIAATSRSSQVQRLA